LPLRPKKRISALQRRLSFDPFSRVTPALIWKNVSLPNRPICDHFTAEGEKACRFLQCEVTAMPRRVISLQRRIFVAFGAKRPHAASAPQGPTP
jgi:hypothetical protein